MDKLIAPEDLGRFVQGTLLAKSDDMGWKGVQLRAYRYPGQKVTIPAMRDFVLVSYQRGVTPISRRFDGRWTRTKCEPGTVSLLTRSQTSHWHWTENVSVTHIYLTQDFVSGIAQEMTGRAVHDIQLDDILRTDDPVMAHAAMAISDEVTSDRPGGSLYVDAVARQLVIHLLREYADVTVRPAAQTGALDARRMRRATDFIAAHMSMSLTLDTLANELDMGAYTFARQFRNAAGMAPYAYVIQMRLDRARSLLVDTNLAIKHIAADCGFADQSHLTRQFSRRFGVTPAAFRKTTVACQPLQ